MIRYVTLCRICGRLLGLCSAPDKKYYTTSLVQPFTHNYEWHIKGHRRFDDRSPVVSTKIRIPVTDTN